MSTGRIHSIATSALAVLSIPIIIMYFPEKAIESACITLGILSGLFLSPDLDVEQGSISIYHVRRFFGNAGGLFSTLWRIYWFPYAKLIPHRDWRSHAPIISTIIRLLYLFSIPIIIILAINGREGMNLIHSFFTSSYFIAYFSGLAMSDTLHWVMDKFSSYLVRIGLKEN